MRLLRASVPSGGGDEAQPPLGHGGMPCDSVQVQRARLDGGGQQTACAVGVRGSGMAGVAIAQGAKRVVPFPLYAERRGARYRKHRCSLRAYVVW